VDILVFESEEELWTAAGLGARTADLSDCCVREVRRAAITPADRHLLSKGVADRAWRRRPHSIAYQGRQWRRPVTGLAEEQGCAPADGGDAVSGGASDVSPAEVSECSDDRDVPDSDSGSFCADLDGDMQHGDDSEVQGASLGSEAGASTASVQATGQVDVLPAREPDCGGEGVTVGSDGGGGGGVAGMRKLAEAVHAEWRLPAAEQSSVEHWEAQMRFAFAPLVIFTHAEQVTGSHDWAGDAHGARVFAGDGTNAAGT
jgi:hypothetical protein